MMEQFIRTQMLLGPEAMERLQSSHVAIFGLGGVGSWCAEALCRTGVGQLTLVDHDVISASNLNRQAAALHSTLGMEKAEATGAAAPAIPVTDTIKRVENGLAVETPDRSSLFAVQTPQVFEAGLIRAAVEKAVEEGVTLTDDCAAVERLGKRVYLVEGDEENLKITTPVDLILAEAILQAREDRI